VFVSSSAFLFSLLFSAAAFIGSLSGCSLYQSEGRRSLERNAYSLAGIGVSENLISCQSENQDVIQSGRLIAQSEKGWAFAMTAADSDFRVAITPPYLAPAHTLQRSCFFRFQSAEEALARLEAAIDLSDQLGFRPQ
jgi:hypothetical protein